MYMKSISLRDSFDHRIKLVSIESRGEGGHDVGHDGYVGHDVKTCMVLCNLIEFQ